MPTKKSSATAAPRCCDARPTPYPRQPRAKAIAEGYAKAYKDDGGLGAEFSGWESEGGVARTVNRGEIWMYRLRLPDKRRRVGLVETGGDPAPAYR